MSPHTDQELEVTKLYNLILPVSVTWMKGKVH